jgi:parallel beta-helix repeat protein
MYNVKAIVGQSSSTKWRAVQTWGAIPALALVCASLLAPCVRAADYWVGPKGRDASVQNSRTRPWASLQYAADRVRPGDTVHVLDGDYAGFDLRRGGTPEALVGFKAQGKKARIVRRNARTPDGINVEGAGHVVIDGFIINEMPRAGVRGANSPHLTIRGIRADHNGVWGIFTAFCDDATITGNQTSNSVKEHGIYVSNSGDRPLIRGNVSWGNRRCGIHMNGDLSQGGDGIISNALVENNVIFENGKGGGSGINCDGVQGSKFQNNLLYDNSASGISLYRDCGADGSKRNSVINNTIIQPADGRWAINIKDKSTNNLVVNNILFHKGSKGSVNISADSLSGFESDFNIVVDRLSPDDGSSFIGLTEWQSATGMDRHSRVAKIEDVFANPVSSDYHLRAGSPATDSADPAMAPRTDLEGKARPIGPRPDIGAHEL